MEKIVPSESVLLSISVVSHGQMDFIVALLQDIESECKGLQLELILTLNLQEKLAFEVSDFSFSIKLIQNLQAKGFGANHNQAFKSSVGRYFCVMNPDIRFSSNPFPELMRSLDQTRVGVVAPLVVGVSGSPEDSFRRFPTPWTIIKKTVGCHTFSEYVLSDQAFEPDWVGGMFMLFHKNVFDLIQGFDERYFLYYEDVDLCARLQLSGYLVVLNPKSQVVHHAQRSSHRSITYMRWHLVSMLRFFVTRGFQAVMQRRSL